MFKAFVMRAIINDNPEDTHFIELMGGETGESVAVFGHNAFVAVTAREADAHADWQILRNCIWNETALKLEKSNPNVNKVRFQLMVMYSVDNTELKSQLLREFTVLVNSAFVRIDLESEHGVENLTLAMQLPPNLIDDEIEST